MQKIEKLKSDFFIIAQNYDYSTMSYDEYSNELKKFKIAIDEINSIYQKINDDYFEILNQLMGIISEYDFQYSETKNAYKKIDIIYKDYEIIEAQRRWINMSHLDYDINDILYCNEKLNKAKIVLDVLLSIYMDFDENRPYNSSEYNELFEKYKKIVKEKLIIAKILTALNADINNEINNADILYNMLLNSINELGKPLAYSDDYTIPEDRKNWEIIDIIIIKDGRISFNIESNFILSGINSDNIDELIKYFNELTVRGDNNHPSTLFQEEVKMLGFRMNEYFKNEEKMRLWGLASDYLIRMILGINDDIEFLNYLKIGSDELKSNNSLGSLDYKTGLGNNKLKISDLIKSKILPIYKMQAEAYDKLSDEEKADLEFYLILTLLNGNNYNLGFRSYSALEELKIVYNEVLYYFDYARNRTNWYNFGIYNAMYEVNKHAVYNVSVGINNEMNIILNWQNSIIANLNNIYYYSSEYLKSCTLINSQLKDVDNEEGITWNNIKEIIKKLRIIDDNELSIIESLWERMIVEDNKKYFGIIDGFLGFMTWINNRENEYKKNLELQWIKDNN